MTRWTLPAVVFASALLLSGLEALGLYAGVARLVPPVSLGRAIAATAPSWLLAALLAWPIRLLSKHARLGPTTWRRNLPIHLLGAALFAFAWVQSMAFVHGRLGLLGVEPIASAALRYLGTFQAHLILTYAAIAGAFHALDYQRESEQRERERAEVEASLAAANVDLPRAPWSPHFFLNTLSVISSFAPQNRPERVSAMVASLGELMRGALDEELGHEVPLRRELELLNLYLDIQRVRFADRLRVEREVTPGAVDVLVPSLILQPLVENAIEHGAKGKDGVALVRIRCILEADALKLEVENLGADGMDADQWSTHVSGGLTHTRARLEQLYPGRHEFGFGSVAGRGFVAAVRLPARSAQHEADWSECLAR
jgi:two-component system, LytTR family, sensor kinase